MPYENLEQAISQLNLPKADWVGFREVRETTTHRFVRDGKPQANETHISHGVMAEVLADGQFGYTATSRTDPESLRMAASHARDQALSASKHRIFPFTQAQRPPVKKRFSSPLVSPFSSKSGWEINETLTRICERLKRSPKIVRTVAHCQMVETEIKFVSSNGARGYQSFYFITTDFGATAQEGNVVQRRSDGGYGGRSFQGGIEYFETADLWDRVEKVSEEALELLSAPDCPTEKTSLILMPDQMMLQIHESIGHPLELDRILGDERNYAGWSFVQPADFGHLVYGSPLLNVSFDPTIPQEFASYAFDDNGFEARKEYLILNGILMRGLGGLESQARSGLGGVANSRATSWNRPPIDRMANINIEPGDSSLSEILSSIDRGILMTTNRSWSIDDYRNKFQFGCEYGKMIENGKITHTVKNPNYRGVTIPFWRNLTRVGNSSTLGVFGTPYCGKGEPNQSIRVGHSSPICLFKDVEVFGGA
jgi:predicted Zn-dependent protease